MWILIYLLINNFDNSFQQVPFNSLGNSFFNLPELSELTPHHNTPQPVKSLCKVGLDCSQCNNWFKPNDVCDTDRQLPVYSCNDQK